MGLQLELAKAVAKKFSLRDDETKIFNELWELKKKSDDFEKDHHSELEAEVSSAFDTFREVIQGGTSTRVGHARVERRPVWNKHVIFSDHHLAYSGHRQNFFASSGNRSLYTKLLPEYYDKNYTLVEAGDVEELVIYEPTQTEADRRTKLSWAQLATRRVDCRTAQLRQILNDPANAALYAQLARFSRANRLVRVAGNHDYDLQKEPLLDLLQAKLPELEKPCDYLLLGTPQMTAPGAPEKWASKIEYAILHGHQFDKYSNPRFAPQLGETISECLAWGYQGADRVWRWNDKVNEWAFGQRSIFDNLVVDDFQRLTVDPLQHGKAFWEWMFKHNIAWEYFESDTSTGAIFNEVLAGDEFFKFRHLDEVVIKNRLCQEFPDASTRPKLVLGHSHEPRFKPAVPGSSNSWSSFEHYFNTAAAGRFENLIWALEIVDMVPTLVSWSFSGGPRDTASTAQRRVWRVNDVSPGSTLRADTNPSAVP